MFLLVPKTIQSSFLNSYFINRLSRFDVIQLKKSTLNFHEQSDKKKENFKTFQNNVNIFLSQAVGYSF